MISSSVNLTITTDLNSSVPEYGMKCLDKSHVPDFTIPTTQTSVTYSKNIDGQISHLPIEGKCITFKDSSVSSESILKSEMGIGSVTINQTNASIFTLKSDTGISTTETTGKDHTIFEDSLNLAGEGAIDHLTSLAVSSESTDL